MNMDNLKEGLLIKNYKELCRNFLEVEPAKGKGRQYHFKELERYCEYHKEGQKIIIDKIYKKPKEKLNTNSAKGIISRIKQGEYSKEVFPLVKNFVGNNENIEYIPKGTLLKVLHLKNSNYDIARQYPKETAKYLSNLLDLTITEEDIAMITFAIYNNATEKIDNAFKNLEKMKYIYGYTDKLLTVYSDYKIIIPPTNMTNVIENIITTSRLNILRDYFLGEGYLKECDEYILQLKKEFGENIEEINKELKIQVFLRGLYNDVKSESLYHLNLSNLWENKIDNYFYSYGYIKNEDLDWNKEIIDIAQEHLHLENYKSKVRNEYLSNTFINHFSKKMENKKFGFKTQSLMRKELIKHLNEFEEKAGVLFDLFTDVNPLENLNLMDLFKDENIPF